jgi:hypothetical protein
LKGLETSAGVCSFEAEATAIAASVERFDFGFPPIDPLLGSMHLDGVLPIALQFAGESPIAIFVGRLDNEVVMRGCRME